MVFVLTHSVRTAERIWGKLRFWAPTTDIRTCSYVTLKCGGTLTAHTTI